MHYTKEQIVQMVQNQKSKPFVIEVSGTPNSGKTSSIQALEKILKRCGIKHKIVFEAAPNCILENKLSSQYFLWVMHETISNLRTLPTKECDVIIVERGLFDMLSWAKFHADMNTFSKQECDSIYKRLLSKKLLNRTDFLYVMNCSVDSSIQRENINNLVDLKGSIVNETILSKLNISINETLEEYGKYFSNFKILDTSNKEQSNINFEFATTIFEVLRANI